MFTSDTIKLCNKPPDYTFPTKFFQTIPTHCNVMQVSESKIKYRLNHL